MKKGASHVDWAISMSIFLIYVLLMFIFLKPASQPIYNANTLLNIVYSGLKNDTTYTVQKGYLMITPPINLNGATPDGEGRYKIRIKDASKYFIFEWYNSEKQWEVDPLLTTPLLMFNESLGKIPSEELEGEDVGFDFTNEYCDDPTHCIGQEADDKDVLDITTKLNDDDNIFWFVYSKEEQYSHEKPSIPISDDQCKDEDDDGIQDENDDFNARGDCLLNDGDDLLSKEDDFTYKFGVIETYSGFSENKINLWNDTYHDTYPESTKYESLKRTWNFPGDKNFKINITNVEGYDLGYNQALNPEPGINVYAREENVWFIDQRGYLTPGKVTITIW